MGTIVCILALLLAGHGLGLIIKMRMFCLLIKRVETKYIKKIDGIVVDVDTYVKDGKLLMRPSVEFTLEGEGEKCCRSINPNIIVEDITQFSYYPKDFHIGDKVTVWYNLDNDAMFVEQKMQLTRLFVRLFIPGCFFIISSILGMCYVMDDHPAPLLFIRLLLLWKYLYPVVIRVVDKIKPHGCILKTDTVHFFVVLPYSIIIAGYTKA